MENKGREIYKENFAEYLLCLALDVGEGMLKNGAEVSRVEDAIERICRAYGAAHVEVFSIISVINASVRMPDGTYSAQMRRVRQSGIDLNMLEKLNTLSREVCATTPALEDFDGKLHVIRSAVSYRWWVTLLSMITICSGFTFFFGGTWRDAAVAGVIGAVISIFEIFPSKYINSLLKTGISALFIAVLAGLSIRLGLGENGSIIIIGSIMPLVPGLAFGTAMRDLLLGDLASGSLKALQSILQALMIAFAYMIAAAIVGGGVI
ncbi:MAG: threonine/serine exporter family protein [Clostridia bacterium]|nr:threonine/serine exporter family protein [Clostridia bacterium]